MPPSPPPKKNNNNNNNNNTKTQQQHKKQNKATHITKHKTKPDKIQEALEKSEGVEQLFLLAFCQARRVEKFRKMGFIIVATNLFSEI